MDKNHPEVKFGKTGVLIINLGTPDSTSWWNIRKYLKEFLSDRRVIEVNPIVWKIILNTIILTFRPAKTAHAYKKIWRKDTNESPLLFFTRNQATKLNENIGSERIIVDFAMRYGNPSIKSKLNKLKDNGCENIIIYLCIHNMRLQQQHLFGRSIQVFNENEMAAQLTNYSSLRERANVYRVFNKQHREKIL